MYPSRTLFSLGALALLLVLLITSGGSRSAALSLQKDGVLNQEPLPTLDPRVAEAAVMGSDVAVISYKTAIDSYVRFKHDVLSGIYFDRSAFYYLLSWYGGSLGSAANTLTPSFESVAYIAQAVDIVQRQLNSKNLSLSASPTVVENNDLAAASLEAKGLSLFDWLLKELQVAFSIVLSRVQLLLPDYSGQVSVLYENGGEVVGNLVGISLSLFHGERIQSAAAVVLSGQLALLNDFGTSVFGQTDFWSGNGQLSGNLWYTEDSNVSLYPSTWSTNTDISPASSREDAFGFRWVDNLRSSANGFLFNDSDNAAPLLDAIKEPATFVDTQIPNTEGSSILKTKSTTLLFESFWNGAKDLLGIDGTAFLDGPSGADLLMSGSDNDEKIKNGKVPGKELTYEDIFPSAPSSATDADRGSREQNLWDSSISVARRASTPITEGYWDIVSAGGNFLSNTLGSMFGGWGTTQQQDQNNGGATPAAYTQTSPSACRTLDDALALAKVAARNEAKEVDFLWVRRGNTEYCKRGDNQSTESSLMVDVPGVQDELRAADDVAHIHTHPAKNGLRIPPSLLDANVAFTLQKGPGGEKVRLYAVDSGGSVWKYEVGPRFEAFNARMVAFYTNPKMQAYMREKGLSLENDKAQAVQAAVVAAYEGKLGAALKTEAQEIGNTLAKAIRYEDGLVAGRRLSDAEVNDALRAYLEIDFLVSEQ